MHVNRWLETHAHIRPEKIAVVDRVNGKSLTYRDLYQSSRLQAFRLHKLGLRQGDRVAVYSNNRSEWFELFFACAWLGVSLVPLNWRLSQAELDKVLEDCQPKLLFLDPDLQIENESLDLLSLQTLPADPVELPEVAYNAPIAVFYTGGTTGVPKGAVLTHESLQWNAWNTIAGWGLSPEDVAPVFTPMFHTGGLNVLATPLFCLGGTVVLPGPFDAQKALDVIEEEGCTVVFMVPTMFEMLREAPKFDPVKLQNVRRWISGGAPCPKPLFEFYWQHGLPLTQGYGLTEAGPNTFGVSLEEAQKRPGTVGVPLPGVQLKLVNGELHVKGGHVMAGYLNRPKETAQVLDADGWLATGDLGQKDEDGYYYISGRKKEMYISGGENVFPAEIEEVLLGHPSVSEVAVVGVPHPKWGEVGRAYLVPRPGLLYQENELVEHCQRKLARYKVPKEFVVMETLPKSAAGKVLKRLLLNA